MRQFSAVSSGVALLLAGLIGAVVLVGCARNEEDGRASGLSGTDATVTGAGATTTGAGGEGAGMTGTEGDTPADNPAAAASQSEQSEGATQ